MKFLFKVIGNLIRGFWHGLTVCRIIIGNLIFLALIVILFSIFFYDTEKDLPDEAALILSLQGDIVIQKTETIFSGQLFGESTREETLLKDVIDAIVERTKKGGGELVKLMGTSAWYAPGAAAAQMVESIVFDQNRIFPCCVKLDGEYGLKDVFLGVPVKLGKNGINEIIEIDLNQAEKELLNGSADAVKSVMKVMDDMNLF